MNWKKTRYTNYKVGDKVICIDNPNRRPAINEENHLGRDGNYRGAGWEDGYQFIIERIAELKDNDQQILWCGKNEGGVYSDSVALIK